MSGRKRLSIICTTDARIDDPGGRELVPVVVKLLGQHVVEPLVQRQLADGGRQLQLRSVAQKIVTAAGQFQYWSGPLRAVTFSMRICWLLQ